MHTVLSEKKNLLIGEQDEVKIMSLHRFSLKNLVISFFLSGKSDFFLYLKNQLYVKGTNFLIFKNLSKFWQAWKTFHSRIKVKIEILVPRLL